LLTADFLSLLGIALLLAIPISAWAMHQWLQAFPYRTQLSVWIFAATGILTIGVALLTVSWQALRAAQANPVDSLR
jgi:putative ABC transport system permease protein